jgi:hypothetical protein
MDHINNEKSDSEASKISQNRTHVEDVLNPVLVNELQDPMYPLYDTKLNFGLDDKKNEKNMDDTIDSVSYQYPRDNLQWMHSDNTAMDQKKINDVFKYYYNSPNLYTATKRNSSHEVQLSKSNLEKSLEAHEIQQSTIENTETEEQKHHIISPTTSPKYDLRDLMNNKDYIEWTREQNHMISENLKAERLKRYRLVTDDKLSNKDKDQQVTWQKKDDNQSHPRQIDLGSVSYIPQNSDIPQVLTLKIGLQPNQNGPPTFITSEEQQPQITTQPPQHTHRKHFIPNTLSPQEIEDIKKSLIEEHKLSRLRKKALKDGRFYTWLKTNQMSFTIITFSIMMIMLFLTCYLTYPKRRQGFHDDKAPQKRPQIVRAANLLFDKSGNIILCDAPEAPKPQLSRSQKSREIRRQAALQTTCATPENTPCMSTTTSQSSKKVKSKKEKKHVEWQPEIVETIPNAPIECVPSRGADMIDIWERY